MAAAAGGEEGSSNILPSHDISGTWQVIPSRSDGLNEFLAELGVGYMSRKVVCSVLVSTQITHTSDRYILVDTSSLGQSKTDVRIDGKPHQVKDEKGKEATMTCSCDNGVVRLSSLMPDRITVTKEERMLESRSVLRQTVDVLKNDKHRMRLTRHFGRQESDSERTAGELKWVAAKLDPRANLLANATPTSSTTAASTASNSTNSNSSSTNTSSAASTTASGSVSVSVPSNNDTKSSSSSLYPAGNWGDDHVHPYTDISGVWQVIASKEDTSSLDAFLKQLNVGMIARKVVCSLTVVTTLVLSPTKYIITDASKLGPPVPNEFQLDGKERVIKDAKGKENKVRAINQYGLALWSWPQPGIQTYEERWLENRTTYRQVVDVIKEGKRTYRLERRYTRQESDSERIAAEKRWTDAGLDLKTDCMALRQKQLEHDTNQSSSSTTTPAASSTASSSSSSSNGNNATSSSSSTSAAASSSPSNVTESGPVVMSRSPAVATVAVTVQAAAPVSTLMLLTMLLFIVHYPQMLLAAIILFVIGMVYLGDRILALFGEQGFVAEKEERRKRDDIIAQLRWMNVTLDAHGNATYAGSSDMPISSSSRGPRDRDRRAKLDSALTQMSAMGLVRPGD